MTGPCLRFAAFYGIIIQIYYGDHLPKHFHALYAGYMAEISIDPFEIIDGTLPNRALGLVQTGLLSIDKSCSKRSTGRQQPAARKDRASEVTFPVEEAAIFPA